MSNQSMSERINDPVQQFVFGTDGDAQLTVSEVPNGEGVYIRVGDGTEYHSCVLSPAQWDALRDLSYKLNVVKPEPMVEAGRDPATGRIVDWQRQSPPGSANLLQSPPGSDSVRETAS